jgi:hypothetical protein
LHSGVLQFHVHFMYKRMGKTSKSPIPAPYIMQIVQIM